MNTTIDLEKVVLLKGAHESRDLGLCVMEAVAQAAGEKHSDMPKCASPVLGAFLRNWNDSVDDAFRQKLKPYIFRVIGTAGDGKDEARAWMATDWLVRVCAPAWLDLAKLTQHSMALRAAEQIRDTASAARVQPLIDSAKKESYAAWDAAGAAAWDAAGAAAGAAAGDAAWAAARAAAGDAAGAAAGDAAWAAARAAAGAALQPTVQALQASALELLDRMIAG